MGRKAVVAALAGLALSWALIGTSAAAGARTLTIPLSAPTTASPGSDTPGAVSAGAESLDVGPAAPVQRIKPGFLGLSFEYYGVTPYTGTDPRNVNPVLVQLIRNLNPNQAPSIRIGGDSTDHTWWPIRHTKRPHGVKYTLNHNWLSTTAALAHQLGARVILGINLEANNMALARAEADAFLPGFGRQSIEALEPGNEPELYDSWTYYRAGNRKYTGRPHGYGVFSFARDFGRIRAAMPPAPLAGPAVGSVTWFHYLGDFLGAQPHVHLVTLHRYPLQLCFIARDMPQYPTIAHLLSPNSSRGLANSVKASVKLSHSRHVPVRIDEMNSDGCGKAPAVTESFASALWALDAVTAMANVGADGVNIHTYPGSSYDLFRFHRSKGHWYGTVLPEYYGLLMFALAAPPGSQPLKLYGQATGNLSTWATLGTDHHTRVLLLNDDAHSSRTVAIRASSSASPASYVRLQARSLRARGGVTLAGGSFGPQTGTGLLKGANRIGQIAPTAGSYVVTAPPASATLVMIP